MKVLFVSSEIFHFVAASTMVTGQTRITPLSFHSLRKRKLITVRQNVFAMATFLCPQIKEKV
jgi:hypothetical protein